MANGRYLNLFAAIRLGDLHGVQSCLDDGLDINGRLELMESAGATPLLAAAYFQHLDIVMMLLDRGADVNLTAKRDGANALHMVLRGFADNDSRQEDVAKQILETLIRASSNLLNQMDDQGLSPLDDALKLENKQLGLLLIKHGAHSLEDKKVTIKSDQDWQKLIKKSKTYITQLTHSQAWIRSKLTLLGYDAKDDTALGLCNGYALMAIQSALAHEIDLFIKRAAMVADLKRLPFSHAFHTAQLKRQNKLSLTETEEMLLDVATVGEGILMHQVPKRYRHLLPQEKLKTKKEKMKSIFQLTQPKKLEGYHIDNLPLACGVYDLNDLTNLLRAIQFTAQEIDKKVVVALKLSNCGHAIALIYNGQKDEWLCIDANVQPEKPYASNARGAAHKIVSSLKDFDKKSFTEYTLCALQLFYLDPYDKEINPIDAKLTSQNLALFLDKLYTSHLYQAASVLTPAKINFSHEKGTTIAHLAAFNGDMTLIKKLQSMHANFLTKSTTLLPAEIAKISGYVEAAQEIKKALPFFIRHRHRVTMTSMAISLMTSLAIACPIVLVTAITLPLALSVSIIALCAITGLVLGYGVSRLAIKQAEKNYHAKKTQDIELNVVNPLKEVAVDERYEAAEDTPDITLTDKIEIAKKPTQASEENHEIKKERLLVDARLCSQATFFKSQSRDQLVIAEAIRTKTSLSANA